MLPEHLFQIHLVLGYVAWLLCFAVYILPRLRSMRRVEAHRVIATLHSFRFFGLVFLLPGVVGPNLPRVVPGHDMEVFKRNVKWLVGPNPVAELHLAPGEKSRRPT